MRLVSLVSVLLLVAALCGLSHSNVPSLDQEGSGSSGYFSSGDIEHSSGGSGFQQGMNSKPNGPLKENGCVLANNTVSNSSYALHEKGDVVLQARCRSLCVRKILENETAVFVQSIVDEDSYATVSGQSLYENCHIYQKVYECIAGCTMGRIDRSSCSSNCFDRCNEDSPGSLPDSSCTLNCSKQQCDIGCNLYDSLASTTQGPVPALPSAYLFTVTPYSTPYFHASAAYQITFEGNWSTPDTSGSITSFVVQVSNDNDTLLYHMASFDSLLVIDPSFGCKDAVFQFLPVNEYGSAASYLQFNSTVPIYGEVFPLWPDHPNSDRVPFTITDDERSGFWGHAVVNMSWEYPNRVEYLKTFTVEVLSLGGQLCGKNVTIENIPDLFYTWRAEMPGQGPISGCEYQIYVLSNPHNATFPGTPKPVHLFINKTSNPVPDDFIAPVDFSCTIREPRGNMVYFMPKMEWSLPSNPLLLEGVKSFTVSLSADVDGDKVELEQGVSVPYDRLTYEDITIPSIEYDESYQDLIYELTIVYKDDFTESRHLNTSHTCTFHLTPPPRVTAVNANDIFIDLNTNALHVDVNWDSVMFADASVSMYNIYVGHSLQHDTSLSDPLNGIKYLSKSGLSFKQEINLTKEMEHYSPGEKIYIQVQPVSFIGMKGDWSEAYVFDPLKSKFQANFDISCGRKVLLVGHSTHQRFEMRINWSIGLQFTGLHHFVVTLSAIQTDGSKTVAFSEEIEYLGMKSDYSQSVITWYFTGSDTSYFTFEVKSYFESDSPNRGALTAQGCDLDGQPQPPTNIESVTYNQFTIDNLGQLNISLEWSEPEITYSGVQTYWVYIGTVPLSGNVRPDSDVILFQTPLANNLEKFDLFIGNALATEFTNSTDWYFYIQVLAVNNVDARSNWTSPLLIEMEAVMLDPSIFITSTSVPTHQSTTPTTSNTPTPDKKESAPAVDPYRRLVPVLSSIIPLMFIFALAIVVVSILLIVAYCQRRKMSKKSNGPLQIGLGKGLSHPGYMWERYATDLDKLSSIGEGSFGEVYQGTLHQVPDLELGKKYSDDSIAVFAASLKVSCTDDDRKKFMNRVEKYKALAALEHPFFLAFEGCVISSEPHYVLTEFVENGDLLSFLQNHRKRLMDDQLKSISAPHNLSAHFHQHPTADRLYPMDLLNYARQISSAMDCLAGLRIVHGDLACRNIYLDQSFNVKVADFGIVANGHREVIYMNGLPIRWLAPEVLTDHAYSTASDVWAFGVTVWEIVTLGNFPYQDIHNNGLLEALSTGERLPVPANCTSKFYDIILPCWDANPHQRPSFESLHETFLDLLSQSETSSLITLDLSAPDKPPQPLEISFLDGSQSPTSTDSAISAEADLGVVISKKGKLVSVANPGFDTNPPTSGFPSTTIKGHHGGFVNPGFRRSSMKSVDLDAPKIQLTQMKSHSPTKSHPSPIKPHPSPTKEHVSISLTNSHSSVPVSIVEAADGSSKDSTATEV